MSAIKELPNSPMETLHLLFVEDEKGCGFEEMIRLYLKDNTDKEELKIFLKEIKKFILRHYSQHAESSSSFGVGGYIQFRSGQNAKTIADDEKVKVFAPDWVKGVLAELVFELRGARFRIEGRNDLVIGDEISLTDLVAIARNEFYNVTGKISDDLYREINFDTIITLRDLVKHCVIVGKDVATHFGGYPSGNEICVLNKDVF